MSVSSERRATRRTGLIWLAVATGPVAWAVHLTVGILLVPAACRWGSDLPIHAVTLATAVPVVWALILLARARRTPSPQEAGRGPAEFVTRFGVLVAAISLFLIVLEGLPVFFIDPCL